MIISLQSISTMMLLGIVIFSFDTAYAQTIVLNETEPCFLNYTAGVEIWNNCGVSDDWMAASLLGFEWVTGGYFSFIFLGVIIMISYIKYHKVIYPLVIGLLFLPVVWTLVPSEFWSYIFLLIVASIAFTIWKIIKNHTTEF